MTGTLAARLWKLSPAAAARALSISRMSVYKGKITAKKADNRTLIPVADLERCLASLPDYRARH
jgi:hypothetical protein